MKRLYTLLAASSLLLLTNCRKDKAPAPVDHSHWDYEHTDWTGVNPDCGGVIQSPIDIDTSMTIKTGMPELGFDYTDFTVGLIDNGHTLQGNTNANAPANTLHFNDNTYSLIQFHFHSGSEHKVNGVQMPMELHLVHRNEQQELVVVGIMIEQGVENHPLIDALWTAWPDEKEVEMELAQQINLNQLLPDGRLYYNYIGSLTTPPCSMGLQWIVLKEPIRLSAAQIEKFREHYEGNHRSVQALNNRLVYEKI